MITKVKYDLPELDQDTIEVYLNKWELIVKATCEYYGVTMEQVQSKSRSRKNNVMQCRHMITFLAHNNTKLPLKYFAWHLGNRDHTTSIASIRTMNDLLQINDRPTVRDYNKIIKLLPFEVKHYKPRNMAHIKMPKYYEHRG